jgi:ATP-dependent RNA helicase DDX27
MNKEFVFDVGSEVAVAATQVQSPWEFSGYSATVLDEHANRKTTSVNQKIAQLRSKKGNLKPNVSRVDDDSDEHEEDLDNKSGVWKRSLPYNNGDSNAADGSESDGDESDVEDDTFAQETGHWEEEEEEEEGSDISDVDTDDDDSQLADKEEDGDSDVDSQFEDGEEGFVFCSMFFVAFLSAHWF